MHKVIFFNPKDNKTKKKEKIRRNHGERIDYNYTVGNTYIFKN